VTEISKIRGMIVSQFDTATGAPGFSPDCEKVKGFREAAEKGLMALLQWYHSNGGTWDAWVTAYAALGGRLDVLKWLRSKGAQCNEWTSAYAAANGNIEILEYLKKEGFKYLCTAKYSNNPRLFKCDTNTPAYAAMNGHMHVLQWCVDNEIAISTLTSVYAAREGHMEVVKWLMKYGVICMGACIAALRSEYFDIVDVICEYFGSRVKGIPNVCEIENTKTILNFCTNEITKIEDMIKVQQKLAGGVADDNKLTKEEKVKRKEELEALVQGDETARRHMKIQNWAKNYIGLDAYLAAARGNRYDLVKLLCDADNDEYDMCNLKELEDMCVGDKKIKEEKKGISEAILKMKENKGSADAIIDEAKAKILVDESEIKDLEFVLTWVKNHSK
jgi:hypothetical protein